MESSVYHFLTFNLILIRYKDSVETNNKVTISIDSLYPTHVNTTSGNTKDNKTRFITE